MPHKDPKDRKKYQEEYYEKNKDKWRGPDGKLRISKKVPGPGRTLTGRVKKLTPEQQTFKKALEDGEVAEDAVKLAYKKPKTSVEVSKKLHQLAKNPILGITIEKYLETLSSQGINAKLLGQKYKQIIKKTKKESTPHVDRNTLLAMESIEKLAGLRVERKEVKETHLHITADELDLMLRLRREQIEKEGKTIDVTRG